SNIKMRVMDEANTTMLLINTSESSITIGGSDSTGNYKLIIKDTSNVTMFYIDTLATMSDNGVHITGSRSTNKFSVGSNDQPRDSFYVTTTYPGETRGREVGTYYNVLNDGGGIWLNRYGDGAPT